MSSNMGHTAVENFYISKWDADIEIFVREFSSKLKTAFSEKLKAEKFKWWQKNNMIPPQLKCPVYAEILTEQVRENERGLLATMISFYEAKSDIDSIRSLNQVDRIEHMLIMVNHKIQEVHGNATIMPQHLNILMRDKGAQTCNDLSVIYMVEHEKFRHALDMAINTLEKVYLKVTSETEDYVMDKNCVSNCNSKNSKPSQHRPSSATTTRRRAKNTGLNEGVNGKGRKDKDNFHFIYKT